ncbi:MAG: hypothetical protein GY859_03475, partial [Desulfobacterales bacterium]|nr:hypothetical protein [Desulfobacterales bacterium]
RIHFTPGDYEINSVVFSLDINEDLLRFDSADRDGSGAPDAVRFIGAQSARRTVRRTVRFDAGDKPGELDFIIADLTQHPRIIEKGIIVEIEFRLVGPVGGLDDAISFSRETKASFGSVGGKGVPGEVHVDRPIY